MGRGYVLTSTQVGDCERTEESHGLADETEEVTI